MSETYSFKSGSVNEASLNPWFNSGRECEESDSDMSRIYTEFKRSTSNSPEFGWKSSEI